MGMVGKSVLCAWLYVAAGTAGAYAADRAAIHDKQTQECDVSEQPAMIESAELHINLTERVTDIKQVKTSFEKRLQEVEAMAEQIGLKQMLMQNMNYSVYSQEGEGGSGANPLYQITGSAYYRTDSGEKALALMERLREKKINASVNVNSNRNYQTCGAVD